jgi:hypothetical protein
MKSFKLLKNQIRFEVLNLLKQSRSTARNPNRATPRRFVKILIDKCLYDHFKMIYQIKGVYCQSDRFLNALGLQQVKRFISRSNLENSATRSESNIKTLVSPVQGSWRFMIRKRTIEAETALERREKITKYLLSIKFVCDTHIVSL